MKKIILQNLMNRINLHKKFNRLLGVARCLFPAMLCVILVSCQVNRNPSGDPVSPELTVPSNTVTQRPSSETADLSTIPVRYVPPVAWLYRGAAVTGYWNDSYQQPSIYQMVDRLKDNGVDTIQLLVSWFQEDVRSSNLLPEYDGQSPTDESVVKLVRYIHQQGMQVMLKPHAEPEIAWDGTEGAWRALIEPVDREAWFADYEEFILHYGELSAAEKIELYCIGSEMASMTYSTTDQLYWKDLAEKVRAIYPGKIIYHATWYELFGGDYEDVGPDGEVAFSAQFKPLPISFWDNFDYAGIGVYFDLYSPHKIFVTDPGVEALYRGWFNNDVSDRADEQANLFKAIQDWHNSAQIPVIFVEIGYENKDFTGYSSYEYNPVEINGTIVQPQPNDMAQANAYQATFEAWGGVTWLLGGFWWQFNPDVTVDANCGNEPAAADVIGYSPCGRPALDILKNWYIKE